MSREDIELARRGYELWNSGDLEGFFELVDPNVRWTSHDPFPEAGTYTGRQALANFLKLISEGGEFWIELEEVFEASDRIVVLGRQHGRFAQGELDLDMPIAHVIKARGGKLVEMDVYGERDAALQAVGML